MIKDSAPREWVAALNTIRAMESFEQLNPAELRRPRSNGRRSRLVKVE
jgi:hypothetical protein